MPTPLEALHGVVNAQQVLPNLLSAGQPSEAHFAALRDAGVGLVLDIRDPMEPRPCDQRAVLASLGMRYEVIPVTGGTLTDETLEAIRTLLKENEDTCTLVHCQSGNRVGGALIPYLRLDQGFSEEDATTAALRMGLRSAELLEWGQAYARERLDDQG